MGEGHHRRAGEPHAEVVALGRAGSASHGATLYVNLEPCCHQGRTPPCVPTIVEAGIRRVVAATADPSAAIDGGGFSWLRRSGIEVIKGILKAEASQLNARFLVAMRTGRPFILVKAAISLDGRIASSTGDSKWITSAVQRRQARALRRLHDGVLIGIGTVLADDPLLLPQPSVGRPFHRIVLDTFLRTPLASRLVRSARHSPLILLCGRGADPRRRRALEGKGVQIVLCKTSRAGRVDLEWALGALWERGLVSLMIEGGSEVHGSFLERRLVDQLALFRAPLLLGGRDSLPAFGGRGPSRVSAGLKLRAVPRRLESSPIGLAPRPSDLFELWEPEGP